jgi:hypothetical protein
MKHRFTIVVLFFVLSAGAQTDTLLKGYSVVIGASIGPGFKLTNSTYERGYNELFFENNAYPDVRAELGILWNEKFGFRFLIGRQGNRGLGLDFHNYANATYSGYHYLYEYSDFRSNYTYSYITPQFIFKMGKEPFNSLLSAGFGTGQLCPPTGYGIMQEDGFNNFFQVTYGADKVWNFNTTAGAEVAYMRQLSPHLFCNAGLYVAMNTIMADYSYSFTEQYYQASPSVEEVHEVKEMIHQINSGIFFNFQWNSTESERAFYY